MPGLGISNGSEVYLNELSFGVSGPYMGLNKYHNVVSEGLLIQP